MARKKAAPAPATLADVLAVTDPDPWQAAVAFMDAAAGWVSRLPVYERVPYEKLPEPAHLIVAVDAAMRGINSGGLWCLFDWDIGAEYHQIEAWLRRIGATRSADYLAAGAALCPGGQVPADEDQRAELSMTHEDALRELDRANREAALAEIPAALRAWLAANRAAVETECAA